MATQTGNAQLDELRRVWAVLGRENPLWAVLSRSDKRGGRWGVEEFLATGQLEIDAQLAWLAERRLPAARHFAVDFGCGAGRLSRALAGYFESVTGVDVSASMIDKARALNSDLANLKFVENPSSRIEFIEDSGVDFVYSCMTLQHIPASLAKGYVEEFLRMLRPGGVAAFQFVAGTDSSWRGRLYALIPNRWLNPLRRILWRRSAVFEMHALDEQELQVILKQFPGCRLLAAIDDGAAGPGWCSRRWYVVRYDLASSDTSVS